ncbi:lysophosphatidic acid receptor 3-like [Ruditapes philippinarum]|uniref:lysophosphatidic acid receptor 3-like n=1 Tax=Ruditapes philippinarum TaxID=129788 RepID=UPI00295A980C|nr:lysophosphatidic acid receptor 3-like [Ruditapes philippinarum]
MTAMISVGWIVVSINTLIPFFGADTFEKSSKCINTNVWPTEYQTYVDWLLIISVIANFVFYLIVVRLAMAKSRSTRSVIGDSTLSIHRRNHSDIHNVITMVIVLGTFMVCWLPYMSLSVAVTFWDTPTLQYVKRFTFTPGLLNSAFNWMIYGYRNKEFRKAFKSVLNCCFRRKHEQSSSSINLDTFAKQQ